MDFNVTEYENLIRIVSDSTLQLTFKKLLLAEFWYSIKEKHGKLSEKATKYSFFPTTYLHEVRLSLYSLIKLQIKTDQMQKQMRIQLSPMKPNIKEIYRNVFQSSLTFYFSKYTYFHKQYAIYIST